MGLKAREAINYQVHKHNSCYHSMFNLPFPNLLWT
uniref:Uncharacterized protein n=1 Tax=Rhizophora mucronata TaxID=61149 RepID=A0A2P2N731_RHIMU